MKNARCLATLPLLIVLIGCGHEPTSTPSMTTPASSTAQASASSSAQGTTPAADCAADPLTPQNCAELKQLITSTTPETSRRITAKYMGRPVQFEGRVVAKYVNPRENNGESTLDVRGGSGPSEHPRGAIFQFSWYGHEDPLEKFTVGQEVRVTADLGTTYDFDPFQVFLIPGDGPPLTRR